MESSNNGNVIEEEPFDHTKYMFGEYLGDKLIIVLNSGQPITGTLIKVGFLGKEGMSVKDSFRLEPNNLVLSGTMTFKEGPEQQAEFFIPYSNVSHVIKLSTLSVIKA